MNPKNIFTVLFLWAVLVLGVSAIEEKSDIILPQINKKNIAGIENLHINDLFSGAGVYTLNFEFPKGPKNFKTELFLSYNSYSSDAFSPYGYAWNLNIPKISRNPKKGIADIYENNDFVVNGEELIFNEEEGYYESRDKNNLSKYSFLDNAWSVLDSKGNTYYYGNTESARLSDPEDISKTYSWNLTKKVDNRGNEINYHYFKDKNQVYIDTIEYAGGLYKIDFHYLDKSRSLSSYRTQFEVKTSKILSDIVLSVDQSEGKRYRFQYDDVNSVFSHLASVEESSFPAPLPSNEGEDLTPNPSPKERGVYRKHTFEYGSGKDIHLLKKITNNTGLQIAFEYKPSVFYKDSEGKNLNPSLPLNLKTLHTIRYTDMVNGGENVEEYEYAGGAFYFDPTDLYGREYAGFHKVTKTITPSVLSDSSPSYQGEQTKKEVYYFHQGENSENLPELGEYEDHISKKGKVFRKEIYTTTSKTSPPAPLLRGEGSQGSWELLQSEITKWSTEFEGERWKLVKQRELKNLINGEEVTSSAIEYVYDQYAQLIKETAYGEVSLLNQAGDFEDILTDKKTTEWSYANNEAKNLFGFVSAQKIYDFEGNIASKGVFLYDNLDEERVDFGDITSIRNYTTPESFVEEKREYNNKGLLTKKTNPRGYSETYTYDSYGIYPLSVTNAKGFTQTLEYDYRVGKPSKTVSVNGLEKGYEYDSFGRVLRESLVRDDLSPDPSPEERGEYTLKMIVYDDVRIPNSVQQTLFFDVSEQNKQDIFLYQDGFGNLIQTKKSYKNNFITNKLEYDSRGNKVYETYPTFEGDSGYAALNRETEYGVGYNYDALDRVTRISNKSGDIVYDYSNLDFRITNQKGVQNRYEYDVFGNLRKVSEGEFFKPISDLPQPLQGRGEEQGRGYGIETKYNYNTLGQLTKITDANSNERNIEYDLAGRRTSIEDLHALGDTEFGTKRYEYDENGNIVKHTTLSGDEIEYRYDELDRVVSEQFGSDTTNYLYDEGGYAKGLLSSYTKSPHPNPLPEGEGTYMEAYSYDIFGNVIVDTKKYPPLPNPPRIPGEGIESEYTNQYSYNLAGQRLSTTYPDGKVLTYNYENGIVQGLNYDGLNLIKTVEYNPALKITNLEYSNGAVSKNIYDYENGYRLQNKGLLFGTEQYGLTSYEFDSVGNITTLKEEGTIEGFQKEVQYSYDDLNRLTNANYIPIPNPPLVGEGTGSSFTIEYTYSPIGNILSNSKVGNYEYIDNGNNNPHSVTKAGSETFAYDNNGNIVSDTNGNYQYNAKDELLESQTKSGAITNYVYNAEGIRVEKRSDSKVNLYVNKDYEVEIPLPNPPLAGEGEEQIGSGETIQTSKYIFFGNKKLATVETSLTPSSNEGGGEDQKIIYHHEDHLGGGNIDLSSTGGLLQVVDYLPFGDIRQKQNTDEYENKYLFGGKEEDSETDLQYFEARYYDNEIGRFRSIDRVFWEVGGFDRKKKDERGDIALMFPQKLNAYSYVENNPLKYIDPTGESSQGTFMSSLGSMPSVGLGKLTSELQAAFTGLKNFLEYAPGSGDISDFNALLTGKTQFTGENVSGTDKVIAVGAAALPFVNGKQLKIVKDLTQSQFKNFERFLNKIPANSKSSVKIDIDEQGNAVFQAISPGKVEGSSATYRKTVDIDGNTTSYTKTTHDPQGNIVHTKDKLNNK